MLRSFFIIMFLILRLMIFGQEKELHVLQYKIIGTDTLPFVKIGGVEVFDFKIFKTAYESRRNSRLVQNVKIVYPWAKLAGKKLLEYETVLSQAGSDRERKKIMKQVEQAIHEEYGGELKKLTISQGKILIKLIDRETGSSSYDLVKDFRGTFMAFFYQSFARVFGYNLKIKYDPEGEDKNIEIIVRMIENGVI